MNKRLLGAIGALLLTMTLLMGSAVPADAKGAKATATPSSGWATSTPMPDGGWD